MVGVWFMIYIFDMINYNIEFCKGCYINSILEFNIFKYFFKNISIMKF